MGKKLLFILLILTQFGVVAQQEKEKLLSEYTPFLSKTYFSFNVGGIFYPFSNDHLKPGFSSSELTKNRFSGRILFGYKIKPDLAIQYAVMRPASWFIYNDVNTIGYERSVWINAWSLSLKKNFQLSEKWSLYGELGAANVTRVGFDINGEQIYSDAHFGSILYGAGLQYQISKKWRWSLNGTYIPEHKNHNQPEIPQITVGFEYHLTQISKDSAIAYAADKKYFFPKNMIQVSYGTSGVGFGINRFFGMSMKVGNFESAGIPIFWVGDIKADHVVSVTYQKTAFRSKKFFSLDWGASVTSFQDVVSKENVLAFSVFPVIRFYLLRTKKIDLYTHYSMIGPTYLTKKDIGGVKTGPKMTYQDLMGAGFFFGKNRKYNFELRIMHYSNGNIFTKNAGVAIPVQFTFGKTF